MIIPRSHRLGPWYGHWRPRSKKGLKKPVCETVVWPLTFWSKTTFKKMEKNLVSQRPGQKPECRRLSSIKHPLIDGRRMPGLELLPFRLPQIRWCGMKGGKFRIFFGIGVRHTPTSRKKKKLNSLPSVPRPCICNDPAIWKATIVKNLNSPPSVPRPRICGDPEGNNSLAPVVYQSGKVLMDHRRRR